MKLYNFVHDKYKYNIFYLHYIIIQEFFHIITLLLLLLSFYCMSVYSPLLFFLKFQKSAFFQLS